MTLLYDAWEINTHGHRYRIAVWAEEPQYYQIIRGEGNHAIHVIVGEGLAQAGRRSSPSYWVTHELARERFPCPPGVPWAQIKRDLPSYLIRIAL